MKISDLTGLSKPITRLIEVVSGGVGAVYRPYLIRRTAEAHAYEMKVISEMLNQIGERQNLPAAYKNGPVEIWQKPDDKTLILPEVTIEDRYMKRIDYQERKRQRNIENVTSVATRELSAETDVPDEAPSEDWVTHFFNCAQEVSSDEMQELWGRILAGEIKKTGSYSLRTLDFIRNITKSEAEIFEHLAKKALQIPGGTWIISVHDKKWLEDERQIFPSYQFLLGELGIMYPSDLIFEAFSTPDGNEIALLSDDYLLLLNRGEIKSKVQLPIWKFTGTGQELLPLIRKPLDDQYLESIGMFFVKMKGKATIAKIKSRLPDGRIAYDKIKGIER
ncbi:MAG: DUF2806 domain-containing protein [Deltaproteobacteria bacterium]|nr:DUF2806 domain-containing protein [Deltaproteobacteria bacterium]